MRSIKPSRPRARLRLLPALLGLVLLAAACAPSTNPPPLATSTPLEVIAATSAAPQPTSSKVDLQVGVDADGNFYRGDPNAAVKLIEYSDFQ